MPKAEGHRLLDRLQSSIQYLARRCKDDDELCAAVTEFGCLVWNCLHFPLQCRSLEDALGTMYPARSWLRFIPNATIRLAGPDPLVMLLILAHWELFTYIMLKMVSFDVRALLMEEREISVSNLLHCLSGASVFPQEPFDAVDVRISGQRNKSHLKWVAVAESSLQWCGAYTAPHSEIASNEDSS